VKKEDNIWNLIDLEDFQDEILKDNIILPEERQIFLDKYGISEKEFSYARKLLFGMKLHRKNVPDSEITHEYKKLQGKIGLSGPKIRRERERSVFLFWVTRLAAAFFVPLTFLTIYYYQKSNLKTLESVNYSINSYSTVQTSPGVRTQVTLPDGSRVWLNSGGSLSYPVHFNSESRDVVLSGEAYFEVVKDEHKPMYISTGKMKIKVYGTKFNVNAHSDRNVIETTLIEGKVSIIDYTGNEHKLDPGFTAVFDKASQDLTTLKVDNIDDYTGWKDGKLAFHNKHFDDIVSDIEKWYDVDIQVADTTLNRYVLYATFIDESVEQVLEILSNSIPISIEYPKRIIQPDGSYAKKVIVIRRK